MGPVPGSVPVRGRVGSGTVRAPAGPGPVVPAAGSGRGPVRGARVPGRGPAVWAGGPAPAAARGWGRGPAVSGPDRVPVPAVRGRGTDSSSCPPGSRRTSPLDYSPAYPAPARPLTRGQHARSPQRSTGRRPRSPVPGPRGRASAPFSGPRGRASAGAAGLDVRGRSAPTRIRSHGRGLPGSAGVLGALSELPGVGPQPVLRRRQQPGVGLAGHVGVAFGPLDDVRAEWGHGDALTLGDGVQLAGE